MKLNKQNRNQTSLFVSLLMMAVVILAGTKARAQTVRYDAQPNGSSMKMEGTSTIHDWHMESVQIGGFLEVDAKFPESALTDPKAAKPKGGASIPVRSLKSNNKRMDEVMQEHIKAAQYPRIFYTLTELKPKSVVGATGPLQFDAVGMLAIAGTTNTTTMPLTIQKVEGSKLKIAGSYSLKMSDYGVKAPAPTILGMPTISTGDEVKLTFVWLTAQKVETPKSP